MWGWGYGAIATSTACLADAHLAPKKRLLMACNFSRLAEHVNGSVTNTMMRGWWSLVLADDWIGFANVKDEDEAFAREREIKKRTSLHHKKKNKK